MTWQILFSSAQVKLNKAWYIFIVIIVAWIALEWFCELLILKLGKNLALSDYYRRIQRVMRHRDMSVCSLQWYGKVQRFACVFFFFSSYRDRPADNDHSCNILLLNPLIFPRWPIITLKYCYILFLQLTFQLECRLFVFHKTSLGITPGPSVLTVYLAKERRSRKKKISKWRPECMAMKTIINSLLLRKGNSDNTMKMCLVLG